MLLRAGTVGGAESGVKVVRPIPEHLHACGIVIRANAPTGAATFC
jgi:hypothetical protein